MPRNARSCERVEIVNRQRKHAVDVRRVEDFTARTCQAVRSVAPECQGAVTIVLASERLIRQLNRDFRAQDKVTDVLSFPVEQTEFERLAEANLGDIVICTQQAARQARENNLTFENEIEQLILHGLLHLCGFDHAMDAGEMNELELRLRRRLGV